VYDMFKGYVGMKDGDIEQKVGLRFKKKPKNYRRLLVGKILGVRSNRIAELEKADVTLRVIALEPSGVLTESISFPAFDYREIIKQEWEESDFYAQLNSKRFLFIVFRKINRTNAVLEKVKFWNFPVEDLEQAQKVWDETVRLIKEKKANALPRIKDNQVAHVRPHGRDSNDKILTAYGTKEVKKCFWLNAKYIEEQLKK